jgi:hypothetical protein
MANSDQNPNSMAPCRPGEMAAAGIRRNANLMSTWSGVLCMTAGSGDANAESRSMTELTCKKERGCCEHEL